jgi:hypothetical protein
VSGQEHRPLMPKKAAEKFRLQVVLEGEILEQIEGVRKRMSDKVGVQFTRSDAVRAILRAAMNTEIPLKRGV